MAQPTLKALRSDHDRDPKEEIWDAIHEDLPKIHPNGRDVLVIVYQHAEKLKSGLMLPRGYGAPEEDKHQGIVGLIVKMGPDVAPHVEQSGRFAGRKPEIGSWVGFNVADTFHFIIGDKPAKHARLMDVEMIRMILDEPDVVI